MKTSKKTDKKHRIKPIHKRIILHASSALLLLGGSFLPMPVTYRADIMQVSAKVAAPLPTAPATITYPRDQQHVSGPNVAVTGSCPDDSYVRLYHDSVIAGVALCSANIFTVQTTLTPGANILLARVYNITDDEGPASPPITVFYDPATPLPSTSPNTTPAASTHPPSASPSVNPLTITIPYSFKTHSPNTPWQWSVTINGGIPPYSVSINWDDGETQHITRPDSSTFNISHTYKNAGIYQPFIQITDSTGDLATFQLLAVVPDTGAPALTQFMKSLFSQASPWVVWPVYGAVVVSVGVFWIWELIRFLRYIGWLGTTRKHHA